MCGIFGFSASAQSCLSWEKTRELIKKMFVLSEVRGKESAGICIRNSKDRKIGVLKDQIKASKFIKTKAYEEFLETAAKSCFGHDGILENPITVIGHARLMTNGNKDFNQNNQPVIKDGAVGVHNGIICNVEDLWEQNQISRESDVDTEFLIGLFREDLREGKSLQETARHALNEIEGTFSHAMVLEDSPQMLLFTNNGSLYIATSKEHGFFSFTSEKLILEDLQKEKVFPVLPGMDRIRWVKGGRGCVVEVNSGEYREFSFGGKGDRLDPILLEKEDFDFSIADFSPPTPTAPPNFNTGNEERFRSLLENNWEAISHLRRCSNCLLPYTFPFITYDNEGVCNYCRNYKKIKVKGKSELESWVKPFRKERDPDCIITLSGGRDSSYGLHYAVHELGLRPIAYTYDWGVVTDLARRNQARMCGELGIEHIVISADIDKKRKYIKKNVEAWLKSPRLGTIPLFMAGDKQYFYHANNLQKRYNIPLVFLCENMLETTNFKSGFCGIEPVFQAEHTYTLSLPQKLRLFWFYGLEYLKNPSFVNESLFDSFYAFITYYFLPKDYVNLFDYIDWDESTIETILLDEYNWELAPDTTTSWRIGDGTAPFYNYIYYTVAGFSEIDTFRSNQIREGVLTREEAMSMVHTENQPRFDSILEYTDTMRLDFESTIKRINAIPKLYPIQ